jgi:hypothetical protein
MTNPAQTKRNPSIIEILLHEKDETSILIDDNPNEPGFPTFINMKGLNYNPICGRVVWAWNKF